jgi:inactivated superfamily I helicase
VWAWKLEALDYKNVLMLSVNEGVLPAGKSHSSYIPYEMKRSFGLPTYTEKTAFMPITSIDCASMSRPFIYNAES